MNGVDERARAAGVALARGADALADRVSAAVVVRRARRRRALRGTALAVAGVGLAAAGLRWAPLPGERVVLSPDRSADHEVATAPEHSDAHICLQAAATLPSAPAAVQPDGWSPLPRPPLAVFAAAWVAGAGLLAVGPEGETMRLPTGRDGTRGWSPAWRCLPEQDWTHTPLLTAGMGRAWAWDGAVLRTLAADARWEALPPPPLVAGAPLAVLVTDAAVLVWQESPNSKAGVEGAGWDPAAQRWAALPSAPAALRRPVSAAWTGSQAVLLGAWLGGGNQAATPQAVAVAWDPATRAWAALPDTRLSPQASALVWQGDRLVAWDYLLAARALSPGADAWQPLPPLPLETRECYPSALATQAGTIASYCDQLARLDAEGWSALTAPEGLHGLPVGTPLGVALFGQAADGWPLAWTLRLGGGSAGR